MPHAKRCAIGLRSPHSALPSSLHAPKCRIDGIGSCASPARRRDGPGPAPRKDSRTSTAALVDWQSSKLA